MTSTWRDDDAEVVLQRQPRRDVPVVVEPRHEHLVARLQLAGERAGEQEVERVMLWPNATSSPEQPRNDPAFS